MAHHDVILILLFALAMVEHVVINELNDSRQLGQVLLWLFCWRWGTELSGACGLG